MSIPAICSTFILISLSLSLCNPASHSGDVVLVAPLYITNARLASTLILTNNGASEVQAFLTFNSLEGEEISHEAITVPVYSSVSIDVDRVPMMEHNFPELGSISISVGNLGENALKGYVTIVSRAGMGDIQLQENLLDERRNSKSAHIARVPGSFSVPVLAVRSLSEKPQQVSVLCSDSARRSFESQLIVPPRMTILTNACVRGRYESRTYGQLLTGDTGTTIDGEVLEIKTKDPVPAIAAWGFAAAKAKPNTLRIFGIDFSE